jgi:hypothetical protein
MLTFRNGLSAVYNDPVDADEGVVVSESFVWLIWFKMSGVASFRFFEKSELLCDLLCVDTVE